MGNFFPFQNNKLIDSVLSDLYEDIHWLLLIAGNVLTLDTDGEAALIPSEVMRFSLERQAREKSIDSLIYHYQTTRLSN